MKEHNDEQLERMRQQIDELQSDNIAKEKELKGLKLQMIMVDTQATFDQLNKEQ